MAPKAALDGKWKQLIRNKPLLPNGHQIKVCVCQGTHVISIKCRVYFYDPVFELLKLETTDDASMSAYFRLLASLSSPLVIGPIVGIKMIRLRWVAKGCKLNKGSGGNLKTKVYFTAQHDEAEENWRRLARRDLSEHNYLQLVERFDKVTEGLYKRGLEPKLTEIWLRVRTSDRRASVPSKLNDSSQNSLGYRADESRSPSSSEPASSPERDEPGVIL